MRLRPNSQTSASRAISLEDHLPTTRFDESLKSISANADNNKENDGNDRCKRPVKELKGLLICHIRHQAGATAAKNGRCNEITTAKRENEYEARENSRQAQRKSEAQKSLRRRGAE